MTIEKSAIPFRILVNYQTAGQILGPLIFLLLMSFGGAQSFMPETAWRTAAVGLWMAIWWATEAVPVPVTAFLPLVTFDLLGISSVKETASQYAHPIIYLFLGAFILALAVERWNLHKRIALLILMRTGTNGRRLVGGFMLVSAFLSMWVSNTSTTMMLLPIALSVAGVVLANVDDLDDKQKSDFQTALLLGLAFSASIGGLATLIGTPTNALFAAVMRETYGMEITFLTWMFVGIPVSTVLLPLAWYVLTHWIFVVKIPASQSAHSHLSELNTEIGKMSLPEKRVSLIFLAVIVGWVLRGPLSSLFDINGLSDTGIAMTGALLLFVLPSGDQIQSRLMTWPDLDRLPWGVLILFGGGLSLASAISSTGLAGWLGESLSPLSDHGVLLLVIVATMLVIFLTELTSNVATTATFLPVIGAMAVQAGVDPLVLCVPITLAASCAFMLPVATPPNAIVFSSNLITIPQMIRAGFLLNLISVLLISMIATVWAPIFF